MAKLDTSGITCYPGAFRIRLWRNRKVLYTETVKDTGGGIREAVARRNFLQSRLNLGLPLSVVDDGVAQDFVSVAQAYLDTLEAKHSTHLSYAGIINKHWIPELRNWPLKEITTAKIKTILAKLDVSSKTKKNLLIPLRGVLAHAAVNPNPANGITFRPAQRSPVQRYSPTERAALLATLTGQNQVYFALLFACGLRPGEALGLVWSDYDGEELSISKQITRRRRENTTKTSVRRKVYVPNWITPLLLSSPTRFAKGPIFVNTAGRAYLDTDIFNQAWKAAHKKLGIEYRIPYTCRHTRAAELLSMGIDPADAAKQLGHSTEMFLRVYSEWIEEYALNKDKSRFEGTGTEVAVNLQSKSGELKKFSR